MKKYLTIFLMTLLLCSCKEEKIVYEDVKQEFLNIKESVSTAYEDTKTYLKTNYLTETNQILELLENLEKDITDQGKEKLEKLYKLTHTINNISKNFDTPLAKEISNFSEDIDSLIELAYDGSDEDFAQLKEKALEELKNIINADDAKWSSIEKKEYLSWDAVCQEYEQLEEETLENLIPEKEVSESDLSDYKDLIVDNYQLIENGVSENEHEIAKQMYAAAVKLERYAKVVKGSEARDVWNFARHTKSYIKEAYGASLDEEEALSTAYSEDIQTAKKFTLSYWNIIVTHLRID